MLYVGTILEELTDHVNRRLRNIPDWCNCNKSSLNTSKSEFMVVTNNLPTFGYRCGSHQISKKLQEPWKFYRHSAEMQCSD